MEEWRDGPVMSEYKMNGWWNPGAGVWVLIAQLSKLCCTWEEFKR
jgi:hypothetical protein